MSHQTKDTFKAYYAQFMNEFEEELTGVVKKTTPMSKESSLTSTKISLESESSNRKASDLSVSPANEDPAGVSEQSDSSFQLPLSRFIELKGHTKPVSALALDPSGTRMVTGSYDFTVKFWDFHGMDRDLKSFRTIEPWESYQVSLRRSAHR